jgi:hypothetical protein
MEMLLSRNADWTCSQRFGCNSRRARYLAPAPDFSRVSPGNRLLIAEELTEGRSINVNSRPIYDEYVTSDLI